MLKPILKYTFLMAGILTSGIIFSHCRKSVQHTSDDDKEVITNAHSYFLDNIQSRTPIYLPDNPRNERTQRAKTVQWSEAQIISFRGHPAVTAPVHYDRDLFVRTSWAGQNYFRLDNLEKLLLYRDSTNRWHAELVTLLPDSQYLHSKQDRFTGTALVDDWWGNPLHKFHYAPDGSVSLYAPAPEQQTIGSPHKVITDVKPQAFTTICTYIYGFNYSPGHESEGVSWVEFGGCNIAYVPDYAGEGGGYTSVSGVAGGGGGGGSAGTPPPIPKPKLAFRPRYIIQDIQKYFQCFELNTTATFQVTVAVQQPSPGTREPWVLDNSGGSSGSNDPFNVGHSFLILTETFPGGRTITRNIGFYPSQDVTPVSDAVTGVYNDDEQTAFNIGGQYTVSSNLFFAMLNFITNASGTGYQVNSYNCTNFVLDALGAGHIYLPHTIGSWPLGMGVDPGDLGEDIRRYNFTGMTRITTPFAHPNVWTCN